MIFLSATCAPCRAERRDPPEHLYISSGVWSALFEIEIATGNRRQLDLDDYPRIIKATDFCVESAGTVLVETVDALQRPGIHRVNPRTNSWTPVSGGVDGFSAELLGDGPDFEPMLNTIAASEDRFAVLRDFLGPLAFDPTSGDRVAVYADEGTTPVLTRPEDMAFLDAGTLLVADRFEGLWRVDIESGFTRRHFASGGPVPNPQRMDLLGDGRLVFLIRDPDAAVVWSVELDSGEQLIHSGAFGGQSVGEGPAFQLPYDLVVDSAGRLFLLDAPAFAIYRIERSGDRTIVTSPSVGSGPGFYSIDDRPVLGTFQRVVPPRRTTSWSAY
jgi:hypothetical protein